MKVGNNRVDVESIIIHPDWDAYVSSFRGDIALLKTKSGKEFVGINFGIELGCGEEIDITSSITFMHINDQEILAKDEVSGRCSEFESLRDVKTMFCAIKEASIYGIGQPIYAKDLRGVNQLIGLVSKESSDHQKLLITDVRKYSKWIKAKACTGGRYTLMLHCL